MKSIFLSIIFLSAIFCSLSSHAQSPIKVTVPPFGEQTTLKPLKSGFYEIDFVLDDQGRQINATGELYVKISESGVLWLAMNIIIYRPLQEMFIWSAKPIQDWIVKDNNKFVTIDYDLNDPSPTATIGAAMVWAYSKKYQALKISGTDKSAIVIYNPKSYRKMGEEELSEALAKTMSQPNSIHL